MRPYLQFFAILRQTALATVRSSMVLGVACGCLVLHALLPMTVSHTLGESGRMMADSSLALHLLAGLLIAGFAACREMSGEMRGGAAASILTKPVSPSLFFLAKYAGIAVVLATFSLLATAAGLLGARAAAEDYTFDAWASFPLLAAPVLACVLAGVLNFATRRPFSSTAFVFLILGTAAAFWIGGALDPDGALMRFGALYSLPLAQAHLLIAEATLLLAALALALATRLSTLPVLLFNGIFFLTAMMSDYLFGRHAATNRAAAWIYRMLPDGQLFWAMDALHEGVVIPVRYLLGVTAYGALWIAALLGLGLVLFRHAELKA